MKYNWLHLKEQYPELAVGPGWTKRWGLHFE